MDPMESRVGDVEGPTDARMVAVRGRGPWLGVEWMGREGDD